MIYIEPAQDLYLYVEYQGAEHQVLGMRTQEVMIYFPCSVYSRTGVIDPCWHNSW